MPRKQVWPHGESYRGPMSIQKGKKLTLPADLSKFLIAAMKKFRAKDVSISIHAVEAVSQSIWDFVDGLDEAGAIAPDESGGPTKK